MNGAKIREIVDAIANDIEDRRGIGHEWVGILDDTKEDIKEAWFNIIKGKLT
jgi:hypothetical protein